MRIGMFYHSLISDWNHGNAHFLRGVVSELLDRGHDALVFEPLDSWSARNLVAERGERAIIDFYRAFPHLRSIRYHPEWIDLDRELDSVDLAVVHEWNDPGLVRRIGAWRARNRRARALFHDTHHRAVTDPGSMAAYDLRNFDGVLAFGCAIRDIYLDRSWTQRAWTWHEAADTRVFYPRSAPNQGDLVWIGNWGDEERSAELHEFLLEPVRALQLTARMYGVRYPEQALEALRFAGIEYGGWIANYRAPEAFAAFRVTIHVPRRPYTQALPGIPTIRPFEALACGIPLISAPWDDTEGLFRAGIDYLLARDGREMKRLLAAVLEDSGMRAELRLNGLERILSRHTCAHRVDELLTIYEEIAPAACNSSRAETAHR